MNALVFPQQLGNHRKTWVWAVPVLTFALFVVGQLAVLLPAKVLGLVTRESIETYPTVLFLIIGTFAVVALLFIGWIRLFECRGLDSVGVVFNQAALCDFVRNYGLGLLMGATTVLAVWALGGFAPDPATAGHARDWMPVLILMLAFMLQSTTEEFVFRGWVMGRIAERFGLWAGVMGNSVLFMLMHVQVDEMAAYEPAMAAIFTLNTFLFSVFLSLLVIRQKSIWGAGAWHAAWNWIFIALFGLPTTGIDLLQGPLLADLSAVETVPEWLSGGGTGPEGSVMTSLVLLAGSVILLSKNRRLATDRTPGL